MIGLNRAGKGFSLELSEVVRRFNGGLTGSRRWQPYIDTFVRAPFTDGTVRLAKLEGASYSGVRETIIIRAGSRILEATPDHRFLTPNGFVELCQLKVGDEVMLEETTSRIRQERFKKRAYLYRSVPQHPYAVNNGDGRLKAPTHRLNVEAHRNGMDLEAFVWKLQTSAEGLIFLDPGIHVHHKDNSPQNNGLDNLEVLEADAHGILHISDGHLRVKLVKTRIDSLRKGKKVDTYDLNIPGPEAFMANGIAVHNSAKTSTVIEGLKYVPRDASIIMMAFNKIIADELKTRVIGRAEVMTCHSYGLRVVRKSLGRTLPVEKDKSFLELRKIYARATVFPRAHAGVVAKLVSLAKGSLLSHPDELDATIDDFGLLDDKADMDRQDVIDDALLLLERARTDVTMVDFDDMIWLPHVLDLRPPTFDRVFIDEQQDLNAAQIELSLMACTTDDGRICAVGDDRQALYRFRGAAEDSMNNMIKRLDAELLPLSVCYRCPKRVIALAREFVPDFEAPENALEGIVQFREKNDMLADAKPGDFVISRINAPLIGMCLTLLREGRRATVRGKDIGDNLQGIIRKSKAGTVPELLKYLDEWSREEVTRLLEKMPPQEDAAEAVVNKRDTIDALAADATSIEQVMSKIESLFSDVNDGNTVIFTTAHKAKGLEAKRVWVLKNTFRQGQGNVGEDNVWYVAITRAQAELYLVAT